MTGWLGHKPNLDHPERLAAILNVNLEHSAQVSACLTKRWVS
jgi:hypothetical protein